LAAETDIDADTDAHNAGERLSVWVIQQRSIRYIEYVVCRLSLSTLHEFSMAYPCRTEDVRQAIVVEPAMKLQYFQNACHYPPNHLHSSDSDTIMPPCRHKLVKPSSFRLVVRTNMCRSIGRVFSAKIHGSLAFAPPEADRHRYHTDKSDTLYVLLRYVLYWPR